MRVGLEACEERALLTVSQIFSDQYHITATDGGQVAVTVTVTQDSGSNAPYVWNYHVENKSFVGSTPQVPGVGMVMVYVPEPEVVTGVQSSEDSSGWLGAVGTVTGGDSVTWMAPTADGPAIPPGESGDFSFVTPPRPVVVGGHAEHDSQFAMGGSGPAAGPGRLPTVSLALDLTQAEVAAGGVKKIHINDNFDENAQSPFFRQPSDHLNHGIVDGDPDVANGSLSIVSGVAGALTWTIDPKVKVWWKDAANKWGEVTNEQNFAPPAQPIPLRVEGTAIGSGKVKAAFVAGMAGPAVPSEARYTVFTGLKIIGDSPAELIDQMVTATGWSFGTDAEGNVWRTGRTWAPPQWQLDARSYLDPIFSSQVQLTEYAVVSSGVRIDDPHWSWTTPHPKIDPGDLAVCFAADDRWGSAMLIHAFVEHYHMFLKGKDNLDQPAAHQLANQAEAKVFVGGGTRVETWLGQVPTEAERPDRYRFTYTYDNKTTIVTFKNYRTRFVNISDVVIVRP